MKLNQIYNMDCIKGMNELEEGSIDIIITSPPYNIGVNYNSHKDNMEFEDYLKWMHEFGKAAKRVLKENGSMFFNIGDKSSDELKAFDVAKKINTENLRLQNTIHWIKHISVPEENISIGHFKPVNSKRFLNNCHEYIFHFTKNKEVELNKLAIGVPYADKGNIARWKSVKGDVRDRGNVWYIPYETVQTEKEHPASFPKRLPEMCIRLHGFTKDTVVLDPFLGSGTTAIVAKELGCNYLGFEIDELYKGIAEKKLAQTNMLTYQKNEDRSLLLSY
jgi:site-specific DNA-methyltransferase (adenine-specific)